MELQMILQLLHLSPPWLLPLIGWLAGLIVVAVLASVLLRAIRVACSSWAGLVNDFRRRNWFGMDRRKQPRPVGVDRRRYVGAAAPRAGSRSPAFAEAARCGDRAT